MSEKSASQISETGQSAAESTSADDDVPFSRLLNLPEDVSDKDLNKVVNEVVVHDVSKFEIAKQFNLLVLFDPTTLQISDADRIYKAVTSFKEKKDILLVLRSDGGSIEAAYFIAKLCREYAKSRFIVAVPRRAKSAATLICCGADEIHLGSLSELGPIDPQIEGMPALALKNAIEHIAELSQRYPGSSEMLAAYLTKSVKPEQLGYYERVAESAAQYAERLLRSRVSTGNSAQEIASKLVYEYKDHGFAIDVNEAVQIFGSPLIQRNSEIYKFANELYELLDLVEYILRRFNRSFYFTGSVEAGCTVKKRSR